MGGSLLTGGGDGDLFHSLSNGDKRCSKGGSAPSWGRVGGAKERVQTKILVTYFQLCRHSFHGLRSILFLATRLCSSHQYNRDAIPNSSIRCLCVSLGQARSQVLAMQKGRSLPTGQLTAAGELSHKHKPK